MVCLEEGKADVCGGEAVALHIFKEGAVMTAEKSGEYS